MVTFADAKSTTHIMEREDLYMNKTEALIAEAAWCKLREANKIGSKVTLGKEFINALLIEHDECLKTLKEANKALTKANYMILESMIRQLEEAK